jgi:large subunit ribosomal protein L29
MNKHAKDLREKNVEALGQELSKLQKDLYDLRVQAVSQKIENPMKKRNTRREIARVQTILREKQGTQVK